MGSLLSWLQVFWRKGEELKRENAEQKKKLERGGYAPRGQVCVCLFVCMFVCLLEVVVHRQSMRKLSRCYMCNVHCGQDNS